MPLYAGISGAKREIKKMFTGVSGAKREIKKLYAGVAGASREIFSGETPSSDIPVGTVVKLRESGSWVDYLIVHQGLPSDMYDTSCSGTWLLRKDLLEKMPWDSLNNKLENSDIQTWLSGTMLIKYDATIQAAIRDVKIPYRKGGGYGTDQTGINGFSCKIFLLSALEAGLRKSDSSFYNFPNNGSKLDYFLYGNEPAANQKRIATLDGSPTYWWLRSQQAAGDSQVYTIDMDGYGSYFMIDKKMGVRPALVLPSDYPIQDDMTII